MNITKVQIHFNKKPETNIKAFADIIIDGEFIIRNLTIFKDPNTGYHYVNMPSKKLISGERQDIAHPINDKCRQYIENKVLDEYEEVLSKLG